MLQVITAVRDTAHGKFWVTFECGHIALCDPRHRRELVYPSLTWDCPFCMRSGDMLTVMVDVGPVPEPAMEEVF